MKKFFLALSLVALTLSAGCRAQVPPTNHTVQLSCTPPASADSTYKYVFSVGTSAAGPFTPLNQASPTTTCAYTDGTSAGKTVYYIAQSVSGGAVSVQSNVAGPAVVPANPLAPALGNPAVALETKPALPSMPTEQPLYLSKNIEAPALTVRIR
jgi:hypothetical protein